MSDEEEAAIARGIAADPDGASSAMGNGLRMRRVGRPPMPIPLRKVAISIRLSPDLVDHFRQLGPRWQSRSDAVLRNAMEQGMTRQPVAPGSAPRKKRPAARRTP